MSPNIGGTLRTAAVALATFVGFLASTASGQSIQGTATYRGRMALPAAAVFEALLEDVSRADAPAEIVARARTASPAPISSTITYDPGKILPKHRYVVRARVLLDESPCS
jgi:putative lipoprotein